MSKKRTSKTAKSSVRAKRTVRKPKAETGGDKVIAKRGGGVPLAVRDAVARSDANQPPHVVVRARAGTGKTFTLVIGLAYMVGGKVWRRCCDVLGFEPEPSPQQLQVWDALCQGEQPGSVIYLAFNRSIVEEFDDKYAWLVKALAVSGVELSFRTVHSLGNSACFKGMGRSRLNKYRTQNIMERVLDCDIREFRKDTTGRLIVKGVEELVGKCKLTLTGWDGVSLSPPEDDELMQLARRFGLFEYATPVVFEHTRNVLLESVKKDGEMDYNDMIWLPIVNGYHITKQDLVLGDEAQDWNACQQSIILQAGRRYFICGDDWQAIYGFTGADTASIETMKTKLEQRGKVVEYPLTVTRRCGSVIVKAAQELVPDFEAHPDNLPGEIRDLSYADAFKEYGDGDMVLCRTNAPLVGLAFRLIRNGRKANIKGRDIGAGLISTIDSLRPASVDDLLERVDDWFTKEAAKHSKRKNPNEEAIIALEDRRDCIVAFCHGCSTVPEIKETINRLFDDNDCQGTLLASVHRSKGLEACKVYILRPEQLPHPMAKTPEAREQENHLRYVAITRAEHTLTWVQGGPKDETNIAADV